MVLFEFAIESASVRGGAALTRAGTARSPRRGFAFYGCPRRSSSKISRLPCSSFVSHGAASALSQK
jgi:hypothetical protein